MITKSNAREFQAIGAKAHREKTRQRIIKGFVQLYHAGMKPTYANLYKYHKISNQACLDHKDFLNALKAEFYPK